MKFTSAIYALIVSCSCLLSADAALQRVPNTSLTLPQNLPTFGYAQANAFSGLNFTNPVCIVSPPGETNRLFVVSKNGIIYEITNLAAPTETIFMNISSRVTSTTSNSGSSGEQGLLSLAFDPGYLTNNSFYVFYTGQATNGSGTNSLHHLLSRFKFMSGNKNLGDPNSETYVYAQLKRAVNHNGGDMKFGPDGYLYVSVGDEGNEHDYYTNAQHITWRLWSGILRLDVDKIDPHGLAPNRNSDLSPIFSKTTNYAIPHDNPFVGVTKYDNQSINTNNVQTEFWATGLRNPWRMSFDPATGNLFCGDVGQDKIEEADIITKGGNYGWSWWEATNSPPSGVTTAILNATPTPINPIAPFVCYSHGSATNQGNAIIGGVVYRGSKLTQLYGNYVFGDYVSGNIWAIPATQAVALTQTNGTISPPNLLFNTGASSVSAFGVDPRNGDVLYTSMSDNTLRRIIYNSSTNGTPLPPTLYDAGAFTNLLTLQSAQDTLQPAPGILPYTINVPFWSDNAIKSRWFSVPNTSSTIGFSPSGNWSFPAGTIWIKHFNMELTNGDPTSQIRLETRFLVKNSNGIYGITYIWNSQTNAVLAPAAGLDTNLLVNTGGIVQTQTWHFPSQTECIACHTTGGGFGLGFRTDQLNCPQDYGFGPTNEIQALSGAGYFSSPVTNDPSTLPALASQTNTAYSLEYRSRSFLAANCSQCHQPGGTAQPALWDARITTPTALAGLINGPLVNNLGDSNNYVISPLSLAHSVLLVRDSTRDLGVSPSIQMPPLDSNLPDVPATNLLAQWILSMTNEFWIGASPDPQSVNAGSSANYPVTFVATPDFTGSATLSVTGLPADAGANFSPATVNGATPNSTLTITTSSSTPGGSYVLTITGTSGAQTYSSPVTLTVTSGSSGLPPGWTDIDVGAVGLAGSAGYSSGTFTVNGSGADIWNTGDQFNYVYQSVSGDQTILARVATEGNPQAYAKAGVMIRQGTDTGSVEASVLLAPTNGVSMQIRLTNSAASFNITGWLKGPVAPYWVKLVRSGNTFTGYDSADGVSWTRLASTNVVMTSAVTAGLAVSAHSNTQINTSTFDNVSLTSPAADFSIAASPGSQTVTAGNGTSYTATVTALNGFSGSVALTASGVPSGANASFNPASVTGSGPSTLSLTTSSSTPPGNYTVTVTGTSGSLAHSTTVTLVVNPPPVPDFSLSASPGTLTFNQGANGTSTITVNPINGFNGSVSLSASGLPSGVTAAFNPSSTTSTSVLTLTAATNAATGTANVTVTGISGSLTHTTTVSLTVNSTGTNNFAGVFQIQNQASGLVLNNQGSLTNGSPITQWTVSASTNLDWTFLATSNGYYQITSSKSGRDAVVQSASTAAGAGIIQWSFGSSGDDQWKPVQNADGSYTFFNLHSGLVLADPGGSTVTSTQMDQEASNGGSNQKWNLLKQ